MLFTFYKYQGTGNDFIIIDNRTDFFPKNNTKLVKQLCDRKFGIGADGLMLLEKPQKAGDDFTMIYYNANGHESTMCGNGGRCLVAFASFLKVIGNSCSFTAIDGAHTATIEGDEVCLQMQNVAAIQHFDSHLFLDTGSPHHVMKVSDLESYNVKEKGAIIRNGAPYFEAGTNVNFVETNGHDSFSVRTFERGVEDETLSCGTGVTAVALGMHALGEVSGEEVKIATLGGQLSVRFSLNENGQYHQVYLLGPAKQVFKGEYSW